MTRAGPEPEPSAHAPGQSGAATGDPPALLRPLTGSSPNSLSSCACGGRLLVPPSGVRPFPRCRHARPPHGPCPAPRSPSRAAATPPTSGFSALSMWHAVVLGPSAGGGGVPRGQVRLAPTCMLLSGGFGSKAALGTLSTQALTGSRDTPRPACDSNGPWAEWATGPRRPTCAYSDLANRVGSPRVTCSWPACSRPAGDPAQLPPAPSSPSRPSRNLGAPRGVSMRGMEVLVGRRGREAWTH